MDPAMAQQQSMESPMPGPAGQAMPPSGPPPGSAVTMGMPHEQAVAMPQMPDQNLGGLPGEAMSQLSSQQQQAGMDIMQMAQMYAQQIAQLPPDQRQMALDAIYAQSAELGQLVAQMAGGAGGGGQQRPTVDMRPLPEVYPERRAMPMV